jgi:hypothetical protein
MANLTPKSLFIGTTASNSNAYTTANVVGNYSIVKNINLCNTTNTAVTCSIHLLVSGAAASANNAIISNVSVLANNVIYYNTSIVVPANSAIHIAQATANAVTFAISGVEYA